MIAVMVGLDVVMLVGGNVILGVAMCCYVVGCCVVALRFVVVAIGVALRFAVYCVWCCFIYLCW